MLIPSHTAYAIPLTDIFKQTWEKGTEMGNGKRS